MTWKDEAAGFYTLMVTIKDGKVYGVFYSDGPNSYGDNEAKRTINLKTVEQRK